MSNAAKFPVTTGGLLRLVCNKSELEAGNGIVSLEFVMMTAALSLDRHKMNCIDKARGLTEGI